MSKCKKKFQHIWLDLQVMSALALQESRERRETKLQVEIESGQFSLRERAREILTLVPSLWDSTTCSFLNRVSQIQSPQVHLEQSQWDASSFSFFPSLTFPFLPCDVKSVAPPTLHCLSFQWSSVRSAMQYPANSQSLAARRGLFPF